MRTLNNNNYPEKTNQRLPTPLPANLLPGNNRATTANRGDDGSSGYGSPDSDTFDATQQNNGLTSHLIP